MSQPSVPTANEPCPKHREMMIRNLLRMRNELIRTMFAAQDYGLPEYDKPISELALKTNEDLRKLGVANPERAVVLTTGEVIY